MRVWGSVLTVGSIRVFTNFDVCHGSQLVHLATDIFALSLMRQVRTDSTPGIVPRFAIGTCKADVVYTGFEASYLSHKSLQKTDYIPSEPTPPQVKRVCSEVP